MITVPNEIVFEEVEECVARGESITIPLRGTSMTPTLEDGCLVTLSPVGNTNVLSRNAVLLFRYNGKHILHRFHHTEGEAVVARGDNLYTFERFNRKDIVAVLSSFKRINGTVMDCDSFCWRMTTLFVPAVRFKKWFIRKFKKHILRTV
ncbi:MAG: S24/S26 family peptidase [Bacteroidia bacterium]|nr:S24/S26 family peptidase [Bacteroidia bacterium]